MCEGKTERTGLACITCHLSIPCHRESRLHTQNSRHMSPRVHGTFGHSLEETGASRTLRIYICTERFRERRKDSRFDLTCSKMEREGEEKETNGDRQDGVTEPTVFRGTEYSPVQTTVALGLWLGAIHLTVLLILTAFFFFPSSLSFSSVHPPLISPFPFQSPTFFVSFLSLLVITFC